MGRSYDLWIHWNSYMLYEWRLKTYMFEYFWWEIISSEKTKSETWSLPKMKSVNLKYLYC